jgi:pimeloyl-ACP methyl ester carboxylesterase
MERSRIALVAGVPALVAGSWLAVRELDRRRVRSDPEYPIVNAPLDGRPQTVTAPDGTALHAEVFGPEGAPTIVLTHGWTEALRLWTYQIQALSTDFRVVAWDLRGHGRSGHAASGDYSIEAFGEDLQAVLEATVPEGERAVVAGHSMGGMTIVAWAGRHAAEVERRAGAVALVSTGMGDLMSESLVVRTPARFKSVKQQAMAVLLSAPTPVPRSSTPLVFRGTRYVALSSAATPAQVELIERMYLDCKPNVRADCAATLSRLDLYESITSVTAPTLVLVGERDKLTPPVHARRLTETLPDPAELVVVPRYGHSLPLEAHADVTGALRGLAERHLERPAAASSSSSPATASAGSTGNGVPSTSASRSSA